MFMGEVKQCKVRNIGIFILDIQKFYKEIFENCICETTVILVVYLFYNFKI